MIGPGQLALFIAAGLVLNLTPGPDVLYIVSNALRSGLRAGAAAALGIVSGCFVHIIAAALGLTALIAASATIFGTLKILGAAYLVYIGCRMLLAHGRALAPATEAGAETLPLATIWRRGFLTNALNPKVALFFLAFVPQFIPPGTAHPALAFLALGFLFNFNSLFVNFGWAMAAAWLATHSGGIRRWMTAIERVSGGLFVAFGFRLALARLGN
jgi:threonine/homoserine/homoserine lactone efflux protein